MDSFFGIGLPELVLIAIVALIVLGPERLPGAMREIARFIGKLRDLTAEVQSQFSEELKVLDEMNPRRLLDDATKPAQQKPPAQQRPAASSNPKPAAAQNTTSATSRPPAEQKSKAAPPKDEEPQNSILPPKPAPAQNTLPASAQGADHAESANGAASESVPVSDQTAGTSAEDRQ